MAKQLFANNVSTPIMEFLTASDTTISVSSTSRFPTISGGDWIMATIVPQGGFGTPEIIKITAFTGNTVTATRGQEGTTAQDFQFGSLLELRVTKGTLEECRDFTQTGTGATTRTKRDKISEVVSVLDFGAVGDGVVDDTAALQAAISTGKIVDFVDASYSFKVTTTISYTGRVRLEGRGATIKSNVLTFSFLNASRSRIKDLHILPITTPYTILRTPGSWTNVAGDVIQSFDGYMPTALDTDFWGSLSQSIKDSNATIKPGIYFTVSSSAGGTDLEISGITGYCINIIVEGYSDSRYFNNNFGGGGLSYGGLVIWNAVARHYDSSLLGFNLPRGSNNKVFNNTIKYASMNGIVLFGQDEYSILDNDSYSNGESGIKTYQYDTVAGPGEATNVICTRGKVLANKTKGNYFDGLDLQSYYGVPHAYYFTGTEVSGNISEKNRHTGFTSNGASMTAVGNVVLENGTHGLSVVGDDCLVSSNHARNNCQTGTTLLPQVFDIIIQGDDIVSVSNNVSNASAPSTYNYLHSGLSGANPTSSHEGLDFGNYCDEGPGRITISSTIPSTKVGFFSQGYLKTSGYLQTSSVTSVVSSTYTVSSTDSSLSFFTSATCTVTLPSAASFPGRVLKMRNTAAFAINSASSNVGPQGGGAPGTAILPATVGKWVELQSNGSEWLIISSN